MEIVLFLLGMGLVIVNVSLLLLWLNFRELGHKHNQLCQHVAELTFLRQTTLLTQYRTDKQEHRQGVRYEA